MAMIAFFLYLIGAILVLIWTASKTANTAPFLIIGALYFGGGYWLLYSYMHPEPPCKQHRYSSSGFFNDEARYQSCLQKLWQEVDAKQRPKDNADA